MLKIKNLHVSLGTGVIGGAEGGEKVKEIIKGISLDVEENKIYALMGPNGSGKSTLAQTLMGHPGYFVKSGKVLFNGKDLLDMEPNERAIAGLFLSFQYPSEVGGVTISSFLRMIYNKRYGKNVSPAAFRKILAEKMAILDMKEDFMGRYLNEGFSGGEKKRMEMLQMLVLEPKLTILDETDSGLDVDALKVVAKTVSALKEQTGMAVLVITHYTRILQYLEPDMVYIMRDGSIIKSGAKNLAHELEESGYTNV